MQRLAGLAVLAAALGLGSCLGDPVFVCREGEQCVSVGAEARCEAVGYCSYVDMNCDSGRRFHEFAGGGLASACTGVTCGDGELQATEECDDGNEIEGDGCNNDCRVSGQEVWVQTYASPGELRDRCYSVAVADTGSIAVAGHVSTPADGWNLWVRQYSADGEPEWTWALPGPFDDEAWSIVSVAGDQWLVGGYLSRATQDINAWLGRIDADGILQWDIEYDGGEDYLDQVRDVAIADNGDIMLMGYATDNRDLETDVWYQRRTPDGQQIVWDQIIPGLEANATDRAHGIAPLGDGWIGVGRLQTFDPQWQLAWLHHYDQDGNLIWEDLENAGAHSVWTAVEQLANGNAILAGWRGSGPGETDSDMWLQERAADGSVLWEEIVASPGGDDDKANALVTDRLGGFIVGGEMGAGAGTTDAWIRRYGPDRSEVWTINVSGLAGDRDTTWGLALAEDGSVYACGYSATPGSEWDLWVRRFTP